MTSCTTPDCYRATSLYLCTQCIIELDGLLNDVPDLIRLLAGAREGTAVARKPGGGGGGHPGSKPPGNLDAMLLQSWLCQLPNRAHGEAMDNPDAGQTLYMARIWVGDARDLVWGPEDKRVYGQCGEPLEDGEAQTLCDGRLTARTEDVSVKCSACGTVHHVPDILDRLRVKARGEPMPPRSVRDFLQKKAKVFIPKKDLENWVSRGKLGYVLDRVNTTGKAQRLFYPGDVLEVHEDTRKWGKMFRALKL